MSDFRVGDVVCDFRYGTGKVADINELGAVYPVSVDFNNIDGRHLESYDEYGLGHIKDKTPSLRHGTWEQNFGNLPVIKPKRKVIRWVNLYNNDSCYFYMYTRKEIAEKSAQENAIAVAVPIEVDE